MANTNQNLKVVVEQWKQRLRDCPLDNFGSQLKYLLNKFEESSGLSGIMKELTANFPYDTSQFEKYQKSLDIAFDSNEQEASFKYLFLNYFIEKYDSYDIQNNSFFSYGSGSESEIKQGIMDNYLSSIFYAIQDKLVESSSMLYLLQRYKKRTEWFTKQEISKQYNQANKNYEQLLEDDLRLFLFDQGVEYPFSTPLSTSGRGDIIGQLETDDPLVLEIKIFDREKGYGKDRIKSGLKQVVKYANDYNKNVGYLLIYNFDEAELNFNFPEETKTFPPKIIFQHKTFYFITINALVSESASLGGKLKQIEITENELTKNLKI